jgi:hypothetical protein
MRGGAIALAAALALAASAWAAGDAGAHQFSGRGVGAWKGGGHRVVSRPLPPRRFPAHSLQGHPIRPLHHRKFTGGAFGFFGVATSPLVVYAPPVAYAPAGYADPPVYYAPPAMSPPSVTNVITVAPAPAVPPPPSVVEYSTGRYELRGDGTTTPYVWVWVPNPPAAPPPADPPVAAAPPTSGESPAPRRQRLYRWIDEQGVLHLTDRWEIVPPAHRSPGEPPS